MLVISRRANEQIRIGDQITVRVLGIVGNQVRLGIEAPRDVPVHREEVFATIREENRQAARAPRKLPDLP